MTHPSDSNNTEMTKRTRVASTKVRDPANDAEQELPSHREAQTQARRQHAIAASSSAAASANIAPSSSTAVSANAVPSSSTLTPSAHSLKRPSPSVADNACDADGSSIEVVGGSSSTSAEGMDCLLYSPHY